MQDTQSTLQVNQKSSGFLLKNVQNWYTINLLLTIYPTAGADWINYLYTALSSNSSRKEKKKVDSISATRGLEFPYLLPTCSSKLSVIPIKRVSRLPEFPEIDNFLGENGTAATNCFLEMPFNCLLL